MYKLDAGIISRFLYIYLHGRIVSLSLSLSFNYDILIMAFLLNVFCLLRSIVFCFKPTSDLSFYLLARSFSRSLGGNDQGSDYRML